MSSELSYSQQSVTLFLKDSTNGFRQPFIKIINHTNNTESLTGVNGRYKASAGDILSFINYQYWPKKIKVNNKDTLQTILLNPIPFNQLDLKQESIGESIMKQFQDTMLLKSYKKLPYLKYETTNEIRTYEKPHTKNNISDIVDWEKSITITSLEENLSEGPKKNKLRIIYSSIVTPDTTIIHDNKSTLIPANLHNISPLKEYIYLNENDYYNPLYPNAGKRYQFSYLGQMAIRSEVIEVVLAHPKKSRYFSSMIAILYFDAETKHLLGSSYRPAKSIAPWQLNSDYISLPTLTGLQNNVWYETFLKKMPKYNMDTRGYFYSSKDNFQFDFDSTTIRKNDIRIFQSRKDTIEQIQDEYHVLEPEHEHEKLEYLKKDSSDGNYINGAWYNLLANLALQKVGLKVGKGYFDNIFKLNQYETVRIGIGYQSLNVLSDRLKFGGYFGYGITHKGLNDDGFRFGFNTGIYLGKGKKQFLDYNFKLDVLEPGRTLYLYEKKDLIRNFFTDRIGLTKSNDISFTSSLNSSFVFKINLNNYTFDPQFVYWYSPTPEDSITTFKFTEAGFKVRLGKFSALNPSLSRMFLLESTFIPVLYFNYTQGFDNLLDGEYAYHKFNAKIKTYYIINKKFHLDITAETGLATKEIPYPVLYTGNGNISSLASIMIQDAFQTMDLYNYLTDKYFNLFNTFYVNFKTTKKNRMRPQIGFAFNMGWGKLNGNPNVQNFAEDEGVQDYRNGFYETGILFTNFLQMSLLGLVRGEFGLGAFYNLSGTDESPFALRVTYKITTF